LSCSRASASAFCIAALFDVVGPKTAATHTVCPSLNSADPQHPFDCDTGLSKVHAQNRCSFGRRPSVRKPSRDTYSIFSLRFYFCVFRLFVCVKMGKNWDKICALLNNSIVVSSSSRGS
jgi:hypothetical protein